jgi:hypothetical protein
VVVLRSWPKYLVVIKKRGTWWGAAHGGETRYCNGLDQQSNEIIHAAKNQNILP